MLLTTTSTAKRKGTPHAVLPALVALLFNLGNNVAVPAQAGYGDKPEGNMLHGQVGAIGSLDDRLQNEIGVRVGQGRDGAFVEQVSDGSEAARLGIQTGDRVLDANVKVDAVTLTLEHDGHPYTARISRIAEMPPIAPSFSAMTPKLAPQDRQPFNLQAGKFGSVLQQDSVPLTAVVAVDKLKLLASYNIELIVDRSNSMKRMDCPGGLSRWGWCGQQAATMARALAPYAPNGMTITTFASNHDVYPNTNPQRIVSLFDNPNFELGTRLGEALDDRLRDYFKTRKPNGKPYLIAVITDGVPTPFPEPFMVRDDLVNASKALHDPRELTVAFLQIGGKDFKGQSYLRDLDVNLSKYGAPYSIVHTKMFDHLQQIGLAQALLECIDESRSGTKPMLAPIDPSTMDDRSIRRLRRMGLLH